MLEITNLCKTYGKVQAVEGVTASFSAGVVGLVGHNGAGKTTLMQMLATLIKPSSGDIRFDGVDVVKQPEPLRQRLGYLPQHFGVYEYLTAREFLNTFAVLKGVRDRRRVDFLLEQVNLHEHADVAAASFSGGMRQRLGIAQALLNDPDVLIVDEPTAGLDPGERVRFRNLLNEIGFHKLVIVSTHIVSDIENMASQIAVMDHGRLLLQKTPADILAGVQGQIYAGEVSSEVLAFLRSQGRVLHAQRGEQGIAVRMACERAPLEGLQSVEATLEEALMLLVPAPHAEVGT